MKRDSGAIASLWRKHEAKKIAFSANPSHVQAEGTPGSANQEQFSDSPSEIDTDPQSDIEVEVQATTPPSPHLPSGRSADTHLPFECVPAKRIPISSYDVNDQEDVRRRYIAKGPFRKFEHDFPVRNMYGKNRHFNFVWFAKDKMQAMRSHGWEEFLAKVTLFCNKYGIQVPFPSDTYVPHGRSLRFYDTQTNDDHFRRQVYLGVVDQVIQELDNRFDEINMELLVCMSCLNPTNSFASYDASKLLRLAEFYPKDISSMDLVRLEFQLGTFIDDMRRDDRFTCLKTLGELSIKLVETQKHVLYDLVYLLLKLVLILPVATASVERVFSAMSLVKNKLRNSMGDDLLSYCLVTFIERGLFLEVSEDDIVDAFMAMRRRKVE